MRFYGPGLAALLNRAVDPAAAQLKLMPLDNAYVFNVDHQFVSQATELVGLGETGGYGGSNRKVLTFASSVRWALDDANDDVLFDFDAVTWSGGFTVGVNVRKFAVIHETGGNDGTARLIAYCEAGTAPTIANGQAFTFVPPASDDVCRIDCGSNGWYPRGILALLDGSIAAGATLTCLLFEALTFAVDAATVSALGGTETDNASYARTAVSSPAFTWDAATDELRFSSAAIAFGALPAGDTIVAALICGPGASDAVRVPIIYLDGPDLATNGDTFTVTPGATGLGAFTHTP